MLSRRKFFTTGAAVATALVAAPFVPAASKVVDLKNVSLQFPKLWDYQKYAMGTTKWSALHLQHMPRTYPRPRCAYIGTRYSADFGKIEKRVLAYLESKQETQSEIHRCWRA